MKINIIGAGISGTSLAYELGRRGHDITIIEANEKGRATSAAAGLICPWVNRRRNRQWYQLAKGGALYYRELLKTLQKEYGESDIGFVKNGAVKLDLSREKIETFYDIGLEKRKDAPEIGALKILEPDAVREKLPYVADDHYGLWIEGGGRVDGEALRRSLLRVADIHFDAKIMVGKARINHDGECLVDGQVLPADLTILANGVWMADTIEGVFPFDVFYQKGELIHLDVKEDITNLPVAIPPNGAYLIPFADGRLVVGATHDNIEQLDYNFSTSSMRGLLEKVLDIAPGYIESSIEEMRVGFRPFTKRNVPNFGRLRGYEKVYYVNGLGASGLTTAPYISLQMAKYLSGAEVDINMKDYER